MPRPDFPDSLRAVLENLAFHVKALLRAFDFTQTGIFGGLPDTSGQSRQTLWLLDASGKPQPWSRSEPATYMRLRLSPDGTRLALIIKGGATTDLWIGDWEAEHMSRLTFRGDADSPAWTPTAVISLITLRAPGTVQLCSGFEF